MNILMVTDTFFPDVMGGSARVVTELSKRMVKKEHTVYVLSRRLDRKLPSKEAIEGVKVYRYDVNLRNTVTFIISSLRNAYLTFNQIVKEIRFDFIILHQPLSAFGVSLSKKSQMIPKIYVFHSSWPEEYEVKTKKGGVGFFVRKWIEKKVLSSCCKVVVLSEYSKQKVLNLYKGLSLSIEVIPGGVDIEKFKPSDNKDSIRLNLAIPTDKFILLTIRNLTTRMGLENLIRAMVEVRKRFENVLLIIGGSGNLELRLKQLTEELNLEKYVKFIGIIEDDMLPLYYQAADFFILPTKCLEGFGLVTLEALACGVPVLGTPVGGTLEILKQLDEKLLFGGTDNYSMERLICEYVAKPKSEIDELSKKCRQFVVETYSWEKAVSRLGETLLSAS